MNGGLISTTTHVGLRNAYRRNGDPGGTVVKYHSRPSTQYRYEHYDPWSRA